MPKAINHQPFLCVCAKNEVKKHKKFAEIRHVNDIFCIALVFSRNHYRYQSYARQYAASLLNMQKQVVTFSRHFFNLNNSLLNHFKYKAKYIKCYPISQTPEDETKPTNFELFLNLFKLSRSLHLAEKALQTKIECVFFAPVDDWIKPKFGKKWMKWAFNYKWSGLLVNMEDYYQEGLKLNVDPKFRDPDYLLSSTNCVSIATIDRYQTEALRSRIYKKVVVVPDISDYDLPEKPQKISKQIQLMAAGRMIVGTILLENENPENFLTVAVSADSDKYFFVSAGKFDPNNLSKKAREALGTLLKSDKKNTYFILHNFEESESINDLMQVFDVCYLNDGQFQLPHPLLSKAAYFNKPVIGSKNDMIGKLLASFKTGIGVNGKVNDSLEALNLLRLQMPFEQNFDLEKLQNYAKLQSPEALHDALESIFVF